jgi:nitrilase
MRVTAVQTNPGTDLEANLADVRRLIGEAVDQDRPDFVLLPEVMAFMGGSVGDRHASAEQLPGGRVYTFLSELAKEHRIVLHGGSFFEAAPGANLPYNTSVVFDRTGTEIARYRKIHLFDVTTPGGHAYRESDVTGRGEEVVTFEADGTTVGCSICYDLRFPELYRKLADKGARVIVVPAAFTAQTGKDHWEVLLRARAIETQAYIVAAGQWGRFTVTEGVRQVWGHSMIVDPWGHVLAQAHEGVGWTTARLDFAYQDQIRQNLPVHGHHFL